MPVPILITDLSTTAASNYPSGGDSPATLDDVQRAHASFIAKLRDESATLTTAQTLTNKTLTTPVINGFSGTGNGAVAGNLSATGKLTVGTKAILEAPSWDTGYLALRHSALAETAATSALFQSAGGGTFLNSATGQSLYLGINGAVVGNVTATGLAVTGVVTPEADNTRTLGTAPLRWSTVYAGTGTINTSDAREKTSVRPLITNEINAAKALSAEIGAYKFLDAVAAKGAAAREHIGMTVQRAIEIMTANGLDPFNYGFVCYDAWSDVLGDGEQTQTAGDRYAFRMDELMMFIARGFEARLAALEAA